MADHLKQQALLGTASGASAFIIWGLSPLYWKLFGSIPASEIIMHRAIWSLLFLLPLIIHQKAWAELKATISNARSLLILGVTVLFLATNWFIFLWAVNHGHVLQTSLGYYINPLVNIFLGVVFLKERLRPTQGVAVALAAIGVIYLTVQYGRLPWIALSLAFTFGLYGMIRKVAPIGPLVGLSAETLFMSVPALMYLLYLQFSGQSSFLTGPLSTTLLFPATVCFTAVPLLLFIVSVKKLPYSSVGFLQYLVPTCYFILAVFVFDEQILFGHVLAFIIIWAALIIYTIDSTISMNRQNGS